MPELGDIAYDALVGRSGVRASDPLQAIRDSHGSFAAWLDAHHPLAKAEWVKLFKRTFRFTGGEIVNEFLLSTGWLPGAHRESCPVYPRVLKAKPMWRR